MVGKEIYGLRRLNNMVNKKSKYKCVYTVPAGSYEARTITGLVWQVLKHRTWHLFKHGKWID